MQLHCMFMQYSRMLLNLNYYAYQKFICYSGDNLLSDGFDVQWLQNYDTDTGTCIKVLSVKQLVYAKGRSSIFEYLQPSSQCIALHHVPQVHVTSQRQNRFLYPLRTSAMRCDQPFINCCNT